MTAETNNKVPKGAAHLDSILLDLPLSVRVSKCLESMGLKSIRDLVQCSDHDLLRQRNFGRTSLHEVQAFLDTLELNLGMTLNDIRQIEFPADPVNTFINSLTSNTNADLIFTAIPWMTPIVQNMITRIILEPTATVESLVGVHVSSQYETTILDALASMGFRLFGDLYDEMLLSLPDRDRDIAISRTHSKTPDTLHTLAVRHKMTRERVRQIENKILFKFSQLLKRSASCIQAIALRTVLTKVFLFDTAMRLAKTLVTTSRYPEHSLLALLEIAGPYSSRGNWLIKTDFLTEADSLVDHIKQSVDRLGRIPLSSIEDLTIGMFLNSEERDQYLSDQLELKQINGEWVIRDSQIIRTLLALDRIGRPATKEEIALAAGIKDFSKVVAQFNRFDFVCRADKSRWAFIEWVTDPYDGIVGEIEQRIVDDGGTTTIKRLIEEIPQKFEVNEGSVRAFLNSPMFVVSNGSVRLATDEELENIWFGDVEDLADAMELEDGTWSVRVSIESRFLNGYSISLPAPVASACGIKPGDSLTVPVEGSNHSVSLIWRASNFLKTVDLGRVAPILQDLGVEPGENIIVALSRYRVRIWRFEEAPICHTEKNSEFPSKKEVESVMKELSRR